MRPTQIVTFSERSFLRLQSSRWLAGGFIGINDLPKKWRGRVHGDAGLLACADELEAHLKDAALCFISAGLEIQVEVILPEIVFEATMDAAKLLQAFN
jgi:hypothetical protein